MKLQEVLMMTRHVRSLNLLVMLRITPALSKIAFPS